MRYNKLVRDKIPEIIKEKGKIPLTHIADDEEYWGKLKEKLSEEVGEFLEDPNEEEFSDILEVLEAIREHQNFSEEQIAEIRKIKAEKRGTFKRKIILDEVKD